MIICYFLIMEKHSNDVTISRLLVNNKRRKKKGTRDFHFLSLSLSRPLSHLNKQHEDVSQRVALNVISLSHMDDIARRREHGLAERRHSYLDVR